MMMMNSQVNWSTATKVADIASSNSLHECQMNMRLKIS